MILFDQYGNPFTGDLDHIVGTQVVDPRPQSVVLSALNAEAALELAGHATTMVDMRTGAGALSCVFEGTFDGASYLALTSYDTTANAYVAVATSATTFNRQFAVNTKGCKRLRVRVSAYTSGGMTVALRASKADYLIKTETNASLAATVTAAAGAAATLTIASPGVGLRHYITGLEITRNATAALVGSATLVITTTNLPGALQWSVGNAMAAGGTQIDVSRDFSSPLQASAQNTATTIVMPVPGAGVLWRANAYYYVAP